MVDIRTFVMKMKMVKMMEMMKIEDYGDVIAELKSKEVKIVKEVIAYYVSPTAMFIFIGITDITKT